MSEDMAESTRLSPETAQAEANVIVSITKPLAEEALKRAATPGTDLEKVLPQLKDTAFTELGSQLLDKVRKERPRLYGALITRERTFAALVGAAYPSYISFKEKHYIPPVERRIRAESQPEEVRRKAIESAKNTASVIVSGIVREVESSRPAPGTNPETQDFVAVIKAVQKEIEEKHFISPNNTEAVANLLGCSLASLEVNHLMRNFNMELGFNLGDALEKQLKFDQPKEAKE